MLSKEWLYSPILWHGKGMKESYPEWIKQIGNDCSIGIFVQAGAKENEIVGQQGPWLKIKVRARRIEGQANEAVLEFLSESFQLKKNCLLLVRGHLSKFKHITLLNVQAEDIVLKLTRIYSQREQRKK